MTVNRESWLEALTDFLRPAFEEKGKPLPETIRVSCGFPSTGARSKRVGEHHRAGGLCTEKVDERSEIFISPYEHRTMEVAGILLHELCHAALPAGMKHGPVFKELATGLGLEGRMTATTVGPAAEALLQPLIDELGPYPHAEMARRFGAKAAPEQARLMTVRCECCGLRVLMERDDYVERGLRLNCPADPDEILTWSKEK